MARKIRIISQITFFTLFSVFLFLLNKETSVQKLHVEWFLQLNPLTGIIASIASRSFIMPLLAGSLTIALLTLVLGRFFCGYVCPLGALIDFSDCHLTKNMRSNSRRPPLYFKRFKYINLIMVFICAIFGILFPLFADPISLLTRIMALIISPALNTIISSVVSVWTFISSLLVKNGNIGSPISSEPLSTSALTAIILVIIIAGGFWDRRFWCQYICPSGAFFALLSRFSTFKRKVISSECNNCHLCSSRQCPTRAIDINDNSITSSQECLLCGICSDSKRKCSKLAFEFKFVKTSGIDLHKRHLLSGMAAGIITIPLIKAGVTSEGMEPELIRPPGSITEQDFLTRCIACGQCIKVCPNHVIGSSGFADGFSRIGTPKLLTHKGFCKEDCIACGNVCPTGALIPVSLSDKPYIKIGTAIVDNTRCIAWRGIRRCLICSTLCPYNAITVEQAGPESSPKSGPVINEELCTGCGKCEKYCPVSSHSAIRIHSDGERRVKPGTSVISSKRREKIQKIRKSRAEE